MIFLTQVCGLKDFSHIFLHKTWMNAPNMDISSLFKVSQGIFCENVTSFEQWFKWYNKTY